MIYLSKGKLRRRLDKQLVIEGQFGKELRISGLDAEIWMRGRFNFAIAASGKEEQALQRIVKLRIAECDSEKIYTAKFMILRHCIMVPARRPFFLPLKNLDRTVWIWLKYAGFNLNIAELVYLIEHDVQPTKELLYKKNRLALSEKIYRVRVTIAYELEYQMMRAVHLHEVINSLLQLIRKKRIILK